MTKGLLRCVIGVLVVVAVVGVPQIDLGIAVRLSAAGAAVSLAVVDALVAHVRVLKRSHITAALTQIPPRRAYTLQQLAGDQRVVARGEAEAFALAITVPSQVRQRVVERLTPSQRTLHQRVTVEGRVPRQVARRLEIRPAVNVPRQLMRVGVPSATAAGERVVSPSGAGEPLPELSIAPGEGSEPADSHALRAIPFPVIVPTKGDLHDNFAVYDGEGHRLQTLTYPEYLRFVAGVLRMLLMQAYATHSGLPAAAMFVEHRALLELMHRGVTTQTGAPLPAQGRGRPSRVFRRTGKVRARPTEGELEEQARIAGLIELGPERLLAKLDTGTHQDNADVRRALDAWPVEDLLASLSNAKSLRLAAELVRKLRDNYAIVAYVPCDAQGRFLVSYEQTIVPRLAAPTSIRMRIKSYLRMLLGARPIDLAITLVNAGSSQSYHTLVSGTDGMYLRSQRIEDPDSVLSQTAENAPTKPYIRFRPRRGQSYAHFYSRFFPPTPAGRTTPRLHVYFLETPPGALFRACIASLSCFVLVWLVGVFASLNGDPGTDAPAFLLVFPAVAAAWLGFEAPKDRLFEGTLVSRLSLVGTTATSIVASGLYMGRTAKATNTSTFLHWINMHLPRGASLLWVTTASWALLTFVALLNAAYTTYMCLVRAWEFGYLSSRPIANGFVQEKVGGDGRLDRPRRMESSTRWVH
jgi:hypothetical protein